MIFGIFERSVGSEIINHIRIHNVIYCRKLHRRMNKAISNNIERFGNNTLQKRDEEDIIDELLDLFLLAYAMGNSVTNGNLSSDYAPSVDDVMKVVDAKVAGKTWRERVEDYFANGGTGEDIARIADTETHRIANTAALDTAKKAGATSKTWVTMMDDRVRDTHDYLEGETVGINDDFYTYDGDHASAPGLFELAENNVNCRCELLFS
jgi:DNA-binding ferritin-like protein (Dps family)